MIPAPRARFYRLIFWAAAVYNVAYGAWAALAPEMFFHGMGIQPPRYPAIWQCLGMVVGLYGVAYAYAALHLDRGGPFILIGLAGKIFGPIGWVMTVRSGEWPMESFSLVLFNDLLWWLPFSLYLLEGTRAGERIRAAAPWTCAILNGLAGAAMVLVLRGGTEAGGDLAERADYIDSHIVAWRAGWAVWLCAASSLLAFYAWWGCRLEGRRGAVAFGIAMVGLVCDAMAESFYIGWFPDGILNLAAPATLLTAGAANGLYTVAGIVLTLGTPGLKGGFRVATWVMWGSGLFMSASALAGSVTGMVASTAVLMTIFLPWVVLLARRLR